ncbi:hypothetical protein JZK55_10710 [Dissulfurispira thermophila]|uniref:Uncharacterized protein n=1 Tax=Dissulfurispira thermophila TaxID=2715679 RepID=A0A7G1H1Q0_9BACT|nr:hypothetical protein [Dissulfurispira thermophila]BCB96149.1 hypothetical protein JZK55_10710 [Dissulfurispira thermophila]
MLIDARGLRHPEHIKEFKRHLEGLCTVYEDIKVLIDDNESDIKKFEMYIRSCHAKYKIHKEDGYLRVNISAPFSMCG